MSTKSAGMLTRHRPAMCSASARKFDKRSFSSTSHWSKQRLVIVGSGWSGYTLASNIDAQRYDVTLISPKSYFAFTPLLASTAVGTLEFRLALEPVRKFSPQITFLQAKVEKIDLARAQLECMPATPPVKIHGIKQSGSEHPKDAAQAEVGKVQEGAHESFSYSYDKLIVACGAYSQTFGIPGVKEYGHFLKDVTDARAIRSRILECFEQAAQPNVTDDQRRALLHFCIVGAGPTGVEFAAELHDLLTAEIVRYYPSIARLARISLYDTADRVLGTFDQELSEYAMSRFMREGIQLKMNHSVTRVNPNSLEVREEGTVPYGMLVWSTGLAANTLIANLTDQEVKKDPRTHSLLTTDGLEVFDPKGKAMDNIFAIGDAAVVEGQHHPATAQVASQKAKYLAKKLNAIAKERTFSTPFVYQDRGVMAYVGDWKALISTPGGGSAKGTGAWLAWRSVYWSMARSPRNLILVPTYWFVGWLFGRDISRF
ncbi:uncharacterized protein L969DRAFT_94344 [Mixia osmundae IAM 14324]|uniref:Uncharacterized protein n=1 Tax=Mixia osmundae (strain CBS 9802 / IAM 14324 / JCM 22182 / KY 12970) TaxID=764103 RepID=G7DZR2_MIXOS|nr:uncharacterized protein L969DRAFT_94344 [Mixia osmundae IAM 14324]KEI39269.1 hypothetical protein L969DRAFT_94344 [Mixia osmundae IAM 14324]GAA96072.1 hypothetical protein E5Q_02733 [Mixia osmundae IAM 14324]